MTQIKIVKHVLHNSIDTFENRMNMAIEGLIDNGCEIKNIDTHYVGLGSGETAVIVGIGTILYDDRIYF